MGIKPTFSSRDLEEAMEKELERAHRLTLRAYSYLGERLLIEARDRPQDISWIDHTGNLRSSIGYVIVHNGVVVKSGGFTNRGLSGEGISSRSIGKDGKIEGRDFANNLAQRYTQGYALIVVAGMEYAAYVEAKENKTVLASAELLAEKEVPILLEKLRRQIQRKK